MPHRRASALPPPCPHTTAVPKYISGRTSYLQVRLEFHRLPQVIPAFCNRPGFGPPRTYSARFTLLMVRSPGFGSPVCDSIALSDSLSLRLHLYAGLTSPHTTTRWLILQKARRHPARRLRPAGSTWFQDLFHSPSRGSFHRSLTVLVHYRSLAVFSLGMWSSLLPTGFRVSGSTHGHISALHTLRLRVSHPLRTALPIPFASLAVTCARSGERAKSPYNPQSAAAPASYADPGLGSSRFARRYFGNPLFSSGYVRCFSSPGSPRHAKRGRSPVSRWGCPIRTPWDRWLPAPPPGISLRGHVLHRLKAPRHPPCALL